MILSLVVYTLVSVLLCYFGWHYNHKSFKMIDDVVVVKGVSFRWEIIASIALFTIISALRYKTGWDYEYYLKEYDHLLETDSFYRQNYEPGFVLITRCFAYFKLHYALYFGFFALLQASCLYYAFKKKPFLLPWVGLLVLLGPYFLHWMNSIRQGVAECMLLAITIFIINRKFWWYLLFTILAMTIHKSAILLLLFYVIAISPFKVKWKWISLTIYLVCFVIGLFPAIFEWLINLLESFIDFLGYGVYVDLLKNNAHYSFGHTTFGISSLGLVLSHVMIILFYPKLKKYFNDDRFLKVSFRFAFVYMCYFVLTMNTSFYFKRPGEYLLPFFLSMSAYMISYLLNSKKFQYLILFFLLACSVTYLSLFKEFFLTHSSDSVIFYHFITI